MGFFRPVLVVYFFWNCTVRTTRLFFLIRSYLFYSFGFSYDFNYCYLLVYYYLFAWYVETKSLHSRTICMREIKAKNIPFLAYSNAFRFYLMYYIENLRFRWSNPECFKTVRKSKAYPWSQSYRSSGVKPALLSSCKYVPWGGACTLASLKTSIKPPLKFLIYSM